MTLPDSGFDRVAPFYDLFARLVFGDAQERAQLALIPFIKNEAKVLVIGGGTGWLLNQLVLRCQLQTVVYLEASPAMLQKAEKRLLQSEVATQTSIEFRLGTEASLYPGEQFDIIITPFLLDLFPPQRLSKLMRRLDAALAPAGLWLFADFWTVRQPTPYWQNALLKSMYLFFGTVSGIKTRKLPDFKHHFEQLQLQEVFSESFYRGMIQAKVYKRQGY